MISKSKIVFFLILPLSLFFVWLIISTASYVKSSGSGFRSLVSEYGATNTSGSIDTPLLRGQIVTGEFTPSGPNLGTVAVRFKTFNRINNDWLTFRIIEKGQTYWYYEARYKTDQFQPNQLFPFGFPPISDSDGKTYIFEIESTGGTVLDSIAINPTYPVFVAIYALGKQTLLSRPNVLAKFLIIKAGIMIRDKEFLSSWRLFAGAISIYYLAILLHKSFIAWFALLNLITMGSIVFKLDGGWYLTLGLNLFWLVLFTRFKKPPRTIAATAIFYLVSAMILTMAGLPKYVEKVSNWVYYLVLIAFIKTVINENRIKIAINQLKILSQGRIAKLIIFVVVAIFALLEFKVSGNYYLSSYKLLSELSPVFTLGVLFFFIVLTSLFRKRFLLVLLIAIFIFKLPLIFHGNWENKVFVPYMTDEVVILSTITTFFTKGVFTLSKFLTFGYPPFLFNILFGYFFLVFRGLKYLQITLPDIEMIKIIYYQGRLIVLLASLIGSYYYTKIFREYISSRFYLALLLILINLNGLFFLYSTYMKTDVLIWGMGGIALYSGLIYWKNRNFYNYIKFGLLSLVPLLINYYGYWYLIFFILVSVVASIRNKDRADKVRIRSKLFFTTIILPAIWLLGNFELVPKIIEVARYFLKFATNKDELFVPFLENINNYPSYRYYFDYLRHFLSPLLLVLVGAILFFKKSGTFLRLLAASIAIFALQISIISYRTDRLFLPVYIFAMVLVTYLFSQVYTFFSKSKVRIIVIGLTLILMGPVLIKSLFLFKTLPGEDTRLILYKYIQNELPSGSSITVLHNSIFGAHATGQYLQTNNQKLYRLETLDLTIDNEKERVPNVRGYFIVSSFDLDILKKYADTPYYGKSFKVVNDLINRSKKIILVDKINYEKEPFGPVDLLPNSLYGIQNPPLYVYVTN